MESRSQLHLVVHKARRLLEVMDGEMPVRTMTIVLGREPFGPKRQEGDGRTPEGVYRVCSRNEKSKYHLALGLNYPNNGDAARALGEGLISRQQHDAIAVAEIEGRRPPWDTALGGEIMIHGGGTDRDWTAGCIAVANDDMDYLFEHIALGTEVHIEP